MAVIRKIENIPEQVAEREKEVKGSSSIGATTLFTFPTQNDSPRMIMFGNHFQQKVTLNVSEFPKVFTNWENPLGSLGSYITEAKSNYKVIKIIPKFPTIQGAEDTQTVLYVVKNLDTDEYDILERHDVENLTEKYGFQYDNSGINSYREGDIIKEGSKLTCPTCFDKYGNYGYGRNIKFMYTVNQNTTEDAIQISESLASEMGLMESTEVEEVKISLNDNEFLGNYYGNDDEYKSFPDIGEKVKDKILCVKKRIVNSQILFDLKSSNCKSILADDTPYYIDGIVTDVEIYFNKPYEELNRAMFHSQVNEYIDLINNYYNTIRDITDEIINSGAKCTDNVLYWNNRVCELLNPDIKLKDDLGSAFSNIVMYFTVKHHVGLSVGQKLTGRYGNKGVTSTITPDYLMPHLETGEVVHILFNTLGVFNRLNIFQLYEQSINFITEKTVRKFIDENTSVEDMEKIFFRILEIFNKEEHDKIKEQYDKDCTTIKKKNEFFDIVKENGIFIHVKPYWSGVNLYEAVKQCHEEFDWLTPYKCYFFEPVSNRWVRMMNDQIVGSMYIMKLKQSSKKNMSACSNAPINNIGLPSKNDNAKKHRTLYSKTPIRSGLQETINNAMSIDPELSALVHLYQRSSPVARKLLGAEILENFGKGIPVNPVVTDKMTNKNVEILSAYLLNMGIGLEYQEDQVYLPTSREGMEDDNIYYHKYHNQQYLATPKYMMDQIARELVEERMKNSEIGYIYIGSDGEQKEKFIDELVDNIEADMLDDGPLNYIRQQGIK